LLYNLEKLLGFVVVIILNESLMDSLKRLCVFS